MTVMRKHIALIALILLIAGCVQITPKNTEAPDANQNSGPQEPAQPPAAEIGTQDQNEPQTNQNNPIAPTPAFDQNQPEILPTPQPLPPLPTARPAWVDLIANTRLISLSEGKFVEINGAQSFAGTKFKVFLESIASTGGEYVARFRLENPQGEEIDKKTFTAGNDVSFEDESGSAIPFDGVLTIDGIYVG